MKKTIILTLAALMTISVSSAVASTVETSEPTADKKADKKKKGEVKDVTFYVESMDCDSCAEKVQENIAFEKGVKDLDISVEERRVAIKYDNAKTSEATLKAAIEKLGYAVSHEAIDMHEGHDHNHEGHDHGHSHEGHNH